MLTTELKNKIDKLWETFWTGGLTNPLDVIEQITYLMFIHDLDEKDNIKRKENIMLNIPYKSIYDGEVSVGGRTIEGKKLKWSVFHDFSAQMMYNNMQEFVFPFIKDLHGNKQSTYTKYMSDAIFKVPTPQMLSKVVDQLDEIFEHIETGDIAIPEIQRPFVWKGRQVRDLVDSLYNGYPTGYLIIWQNPDVKLKSGQSAVGKKVLIDGQQRITAMMTAISGHKILTEDYEEKTIRIAFNPLAADDEERFAVTTPAHEKSSFWIPDISVVFKPDFDSYEFVDNYAEKNPGVSKKEVNQRVTQLLNI